MAPSNTGAEEKVVRAVKNGKAASSQAAKQQKAAEDQSKKRKRTGDNDDDDDTAAAPSAPPAKKKTKAQPEDYAQVQWLRAQIIDNACAKYGRGAQSEWLLPLHWDPREDDTAQPPVVAGWVVSLVYAPQGGGERDVKIVSEAWERVTDAFDEVLGETFEGVRCLSEYLMERDQ